MSVVETQATTDDGVVCGADAAFIREVLAYMEAHLEHWSQRTFRGQNECGTTYCMAGFAYVLKTGNDIWPNDFDIETAAANWLGLSASDANQLFFYITSDDEERPRRYVTFPEFCRRVEQVTGVRYVPQETG